MNSFIRSISKSGLLIALYIPLLSYASIAEFNAAMKAGDYPAAAKEAMGVWENFDKDGKQTATVAREFGFVNYLARDYDNAEMLARFLVEKGAGLSVPDNQPATSNLLLKLTQFSALRGEKEREALFTAIEARLAADGVDQISLLGAETLFRNDWAGGQWALTKESAAMAGKLYARAGAAYLKPMRETEVIVAASDFLQAPTYQDYDLIVAAHNRIVADINGSDDEKNQASLLELKWQAQAWTHTMEAYFHSTYSKAGTIISNRLKYQDLASVKSDVLPTDDSDDNKVVCAGSVDVGNLTYPQRWAEQRLVGTAIVQLNFDNEGKVSASKILTEAPPGVFADALNDTLSSFRWQVNPGVDKEACRLNQNNTVQVVGFWQNCAGIFMRGDCRGTTIQAPPKPGDTANF